MIPHHHHLAGAADHRFSAAGDHRLSASGDHRPRYDHHHQRPPLTSPQFADPNYRSPRFLSHRHNVEHLADIHPPMVSTFDDRYFSPSPRHQDGIFVRDSWPDRRGLGPPLPPPPPPQPRFRDDLFDGRIDCGSGNWGDEERRRLSASYVGNGSSHRIHNPNPNFDLLGERRGFLPQDLEFGGKPVRIGRISLEPRWDGADSLPVLPNLATERRGDSSYLDMYRGDFCADDRGREAGFGAEQRIRPPYSPMMRSSSHTYMVRDRKLFENAMDVPYDKAVTGREYRFDEAFVTNNKGKRRLSNEGNEFTQQRSLDRPPAKRSALSRIQSGVSVWKRIEQKPSFLSSSAPVSVHDLSNEQQLEVDLLDLSFKDKMAPKVVSPSSPGMASLNGKTPNLVAGNSKMGKKKQIRRRSRAVPINTGLLEFDKKDEDAHRQISGLCLEIASNSGALEAPLAPSRPLNLTSPQRDSKLTASTMVHIEMEGRTPKSIITNEEGEVEDESLIAAYCEMKAGMDTNSKDSDTNRKASSKFHEILIHSDEVKTLITSSKPSKLSSPQAYSKMSTSTVHLDTEERSPQSFTAKLEGAEQKPFTASCSEVKAYSDSCPRFSEQQLEYVGTLVEVGLAQEPNTKIMGNSSNKDNMHEDESRLKQNNGRHYFNTSPDTVDAENVSLQPYQEEKAEVSLCTDSVNHPSFDVSICNDSDQVHSNLERHVDSGNDSEYSGHTLEPPALSPAATDGEAMTTALHHSEAISDSSFLGTKGAPLLAQVKVLSLEQYVPGKTMDVIQDSLSLHTDVKPQMSDCLKQDENLTSFLVSEPYSCMPDVDSSIVVSDDHAEPDFFLDELPSTDNCADKNGRDYKKRRIDIEGTATMTKSDLFVSEAKGFIKSDMTTLQDKPMHKETYMLQSLEPKKQANSKATDGIQCFKPKTVLSSVAPKVLPGQVSSVATSQGLPRSASNARNRTWHRKSPLPLSVTFANNVLRNTKGVTSSKLSPKKYGKPQTSYVRKGNSLVRKSSADLPPRPSNVLSASSKLSKYVTKAGAQLDAKGVINSSIASSSHTIEQPKTPPLPLAFNSGSPISNSPTHSSPSLLETPIAERRTCIPTKAVGLNLHESNRPAVMTTQYSTPSQNKKVMYVKNKSNQLVAAVQLNTNNPPNNFVEKTQTSSFTPTDLYYRRKKNQLIRSGSLDNLQKQDLLPAYDSSSEPKKVPLDAAKKGSLSDFLKKRLKVRHKTNKRASFSNVWTLSGDGKGTKVLDRQKVLPFIPWKRTVYWTRTSSLLKRYSLSPECQKLYLQKVGAGCGLKWSRSTSRRSKIVIKEAKSAATEVERKKKERRTLSSVSVNDKRRKSLSCERIYRVGSAQYKMDSSRHTLIRLSDEESSAVTAAKPDVKDSSGNCQKSLVPKRLQIGREEYIRIGNGNQLIRNPKKIVRILASEKVRWSLHTARMRLARKQQYCQFFTRFGECNKKGGQCPYIHDPAKVAICTKFLRGSCSNTTCKLTHEIIPERMPDCSFFLQGLCTNTCCPYRHVNVNPNAVVCEGFLKGYCGDGDECLKKHSYICPVFEATGKCPQGSKCKLHHPKSKCKSKNRNRLMAQNSSWGRYFGSTISKVGEPLISYSNKKAMEKVAENHLSYHGWFAEFISLDLNDQSSVGFDVPSDSHQIYLDSEESDMEDDNLDALIKPLQIMKRDSPVIPTASV